MSIQQQDFGCLPDGQAVTLYRLSHDSGMEVEVLSLGATIRSWRLPDGRDIVLGFETLDDYLQDSAYVGATVGRYANRIANGQFTLNGTAHQVSVNLQGNCLHGGTDGFHRRLWQLDEAAEGPTPCLTLSLTSEDGDQGFPGTLEMQVSFTLSESGLAIVYRARCDQDTVFNPTQHSYFNLDGHAAGPVLQHRFRLAASHYTPANEVSVPTGEIRDVTGSAFDLRQAKTLEAILASDNAELQQTQGPDHNWCVDGYRTPQTQARLCGEVWSSTGDVKMTVLTSMPGVQLYCANFLGAQPAGKSATPYGQYHGFCLETQFYPDTPNQPGFPAATLKAGETFYSVTEYQIQKMPG